MHRDVDHSAVRTAVPVGQTIVRFHFPDAPPRTRHWWLVIRPDDVDVRDDDPEQPVTVAVIADLRTMVQLSRARKSSL